MAGPAMFWNREEGCSYFKQLWILFNGSTYLCHGGGDDVGARADHVTHAQQDNVRGGETATQGSGHQVVRADAGRLGALGARPEAAQTGAEVQGHDCGWGKMNLEDLREMEMK